MATATAERPVNELLPAQSPTTLAINFEATKEQLTMLVTTSGTLRVKGIDDKAGIAVVRERRMELKNLRVNIEKRRKELKADSIEFGKKVDGVAKELTAIIEPEEKRLEYEENVVKRHEAKLAEEQAQRDKEAEDRRQSMVRERLRLLQECGKTYLADDVAGLDDTDFGCLLSAEKADKQKRDEQAAAEAAERDRVAEANRIESEKLAAERAELDRQRKEQAAAQAKIDTENKRIADEQAAKVRAAELEKAKAEAAEKARLDAIAEQERIATEARAAADAEAAELARLESLRPDHEKLLVIAATVEAIAMPPVSVSAAKAASRIEELLAECVIGIREVANTLRRTSETA